jgi:uncharacterized protein (TIGR02246 family)
MNSRRSLACLLAALCVLVAAFGAAQSAESSAPSPAERAVRALERSWLDAYEQLDTLAMARIVGDDFLITFPDGSTQTKPHIIASLRAALGRPTPPATRFRTEEVAARTYGGHTVVLSGVVVTIGQRDGKTTEERSRYTDTYVKRGSRWQVVASHLSNAPAPAKR